MEYTESTESSKLIKLCQERFLNPQNSENKTHIESSCYNKYRKDSDYSYKNIKYDESIDIKSTTFYGLKINTHKLSDSTENLISEKKSLNDSASTTGKSRLREDSMILETKENINDNNFCCANSLFKRESSIEEKELESSD